MFCRKCGANLPEGSKFCPSCGATQEEETHSSWFPTWKLVSGILSIVSGGIMLLPSCAISCVAGAVENDTWIDLGASLLWTSALILAAGIVSVASRNSTRQRGTIAVLALNVLAVAMCWANEPPYTVWAAICAAVAMIYLILSHDKS